MKKLIYLIILCALFSCNGKSTKNTSILVGGLIEVDMYKKYLSKDIFIQDVADIEYIPLETRPDILLDEIALDKICMSDSLIVTNNSEGSVFVFNKRGKSIHSFNHMGRGGEEYVSLKKMAVDFDRQEIYISDDMQKICVYGFEGSFKRILRLPSGCNVMIHLFNYDEDFLLGCSSSVISTPKYLVDPIDKQPYLLISKKDGSIISLDLTFQERILSAANISDPDNGGGFFYNYPLTSIMKNGNEFLIADYGTDTIYRLENKTLTPCFLKCPSLTWKKERPVIGWIASRTNRYTFMCFMEQSLRPNRFYKKIVYDQQAGDFFEYNLINLDYQPSQKISFDWLYEYDLPSGYVRFKLSPIQLRNDYQAGKLSGKLKEIAETLEEDANPVLMLVKFRD